MLFIISYFIVLYCTSLLFKCPPYEFSRELSNSAPLHVCRKTTGVMSNTRWLTTTTQSNWDLNQFLSSPVLQTSTEGRGRKLILPNPGFPCFIPAEPRTRPPLIARRGQRPAFGSRLPGIAAAAATITRSRCFLCFIFLHVDRNGGAQR